MENFNFKKNSMLLLVCLLTTAQISWAQPNVSFVSRISGLTSPMQMVNAGDGSNRIFVAEKGGAIKVYDQSFASLGTFLTVTGIVASGEQGLLSLAFHPAYATNGLFFVFYTNAAGDLEIARFQVSAGNVNVANASSKVVVLTIPHPTNSNHNGGEMHFGPDGNLYVSIGDGGGGGDGPNNAQNTGVLLGKILRIAVNTSATAPFYANPADNPFPAGNGPKNEIFALGLRNPFRWSFDSGTGDMWIGDVGQSQWEEINHRTAATLNGANYGWSCYEGESIYNQSRCVDGAQYHFPVHQYATNSSAGNSVVGGVVYRGTVTTNQPMQGYYFGADYSSGDIHIVGPVGGAMTTTVQTAALTNISDFGEAENGEIFAVSLSAGAVYAVSYATPLPVDLVSFTGTTGVEGVRLGWETAMEKNFKQFDVEYSTNAKVFSQIGTVTSLNTLSGSRYQFFHQVKYRGNNYYRLKMIDKDESYQYSKIITLNTDGEDLASNFVRPSLIDTKTMHVLLEEPFSSLELVSAGGAVMYRQDVSNKSGTLSIPVNSFASGMYIVRLQGNERVLNQKILIVQ